MERFELIHEPSGRKRLAVPFRGARLLRNPMYTKGSAFTQEERHALGLEGLLPHAVTTMDQQARRVYASIQRKQDPLEKYIGLAALQDRNEHLFYRVLVDHIQEFLPIVYTPTVGKACQEFSHIFRRARGIWITPEHRGHVAEVLRNAPFEDIRLIVVTDNERILGLGDQGVGGMGIPIGKLALYTAAAGIPPWQTLPISLDVGTDNLDLLEDEFYLGWRAPRLRGPEYDTLVDEFVHAVKAVFPKALLQWEDFKKFNAFRLMERYRKTITSFNDDIQGTAAVGVAAMIAGSRATGIPIQEQKVLFLGSGAAGIGIARLVRETLKRSGLDGVALMAATASLDIQGLLVDDDPGLDPLQKPFAWPAAWAEGMGLGRDQKRDLVSVIKAFKPTMLVGTSGTAGAFTEEAVREMAALRDRPVILPMSNPTSKCEAKPKDILAWTEGRALVATGSPFDPVQFNGREIRIGQSNNVFIFPGVGLGVMVSESREVTDGMFAAAARQLAAEVRDEDLEAGSLFPSTSRIREVTAHVAEAVVKEARDSGVADRPLPDGDIAAAVAAAMWTPAYAPADPAPLANPAERNLVPALT
ncbi:MAG TPA: NAD-dependent malic enzyme [Geothrix sp.]|nr:NAD-dependent malic enzyme [Geothrix sp.]